MGDLLKLHVLDVGGALSLEHASVESEVTGLTSGSLEHLDDGNSIDDLGEAEPEEELGHTSLLDAGVVGGGGGDTLEGLRDGEDAEAAVDGDVSQPGHHADAAVLELSLAEEVHGGEVREAEGVESDISNVSLEVGGGLKEGEGLRLSLEGGGGDCSQQSKDKENTGL